MKGITNRRDIFSSKYPTAEISDENNNVEFVPIKYTIADEFFIAIMNRQIYLFRLKGNRLLTNKTVLGRPFGIYRYDISHYLPVGKEVADLAHWLLDNHLPIMDPKTLKIITALGEKENKDFTEHDLNALIKELHEIVKTAKTDPDLKFETNVANDLIAHLNKLPIKKIVTPCRPLKEFLTNDLKTHSPRALGNIITMLITGNEFQKEMSNTPITKKKPVMKLMIILLTALMGVGGLAIAYTEGYLDPVLGIVTTNPITSITSSVSDYDPSVLTARYSNPLDMLTAIQNGQLDYNLLPDEFKALVNSIDGTTITTTPVPPPPPPSEQESDFGIDFIPDIQDLLPFGNNNEDTTDNNIVEDTTTTITTDSHTITTTTTTEIPESQPTTTPQPLNIITHNNTLLTINTTDWFKRCEPQWSYNDCLKFNISTTPIPRHEKNYLYTNMIGDWSTPDLPPDYALTSQNKTLTFQDRIDFYNAYVDWHQDINYFTAPDHYTNGTLADYLGKIGVLEEEEE